MILLSLTINLIDYVYCLVAIFITLVYYFKFLNYYLTTLIHEYVICYFKFPI